MKRKFLRIGPCMAESECGTVCVVGAGIWQIEYRNAGRSMQLYAPDELDWNKQLSTDIHWPEEPIWNTGEKLTAVESMQVREDLLEAMEILESKANFCRATDLQLFDS